jgi:hypothetical protein
VSNKLTFAAPCPLCGSTEHEKYLYQGVEVFACPKAPPDRVLFMRMKSGAEIYTTPEKDASKTPILDALKKKGFKPSDLTGEVVTKEIVYKEPDE